jgi:Ribulose-phosphate 3 epimerase family
LADRGLILRAIASRTPTWAPKLVAGPLETYPRVFGIAGAFVAHTDSCFDAEILIRAINAYQSVHPGFGGQEFMPAMLPKIRHLRQFCQARGLDPFIEVDGGENGASAGQAIEAGANAIVAGTAIFGSQDYSAAIAALRHARPGQAIVSDEFQLPIDPSAAKPELRGRQSSQPT